MIWVKEHPEPPIGKKSDWYWFYSEEDGLSIQEVWTNRCWWRDGWWGDGIEKPDDLPPKEEKVEPILEEKPKKRRGRPKKK